VQKEAGEERQHMLLFQPSCLPLTRECSREAVREKAVLMRKRGTVQCHERGGVSRQVRRKRLPSEESFASPG